MNRRVSHLMRAVLVLLAGLSGVGCLGCASGQTSSAAAVATVASLAECLDRVASSPLSLGQDSAPVPDLLKPPKGSAFIEPQYRTCVLRATAHEAEPPSGFARNDYSRRQAFNRDNSRFLVYALDGYWHLYDAANFTWQARLDGPASDAEPQWHPDDPDRLYYLPTNGIGMVINELNVRTGRSRQIADLSDRIRARWPSANAAWTRSEGSPSRDGRYWALQVEDEQFGALGLLVWDRDEDRIVSFMDNRERPDHLSMSPSGRHVVVSWLNGTRAYDREFNNERLLQGRTEHSDLAVGADGHDVYVSIDYASNDGWIFMVNLETGQRTDLLRTYIRGSATAMHFSGKGYERPGWVLVSTYARVKQPEWLHDKIFVMELAADPRIIPLAHHHSVAAGYWSEPQASVSRDFTRVLFNSNWANPSETDIDAYFIRIPDGGLPD